MRPPVLVGFLFGLGLASGAVVIAANKLYTPPPAPAMVAVQPTPQVEMRAVVVSSGAVRYGDALGQDGVEVVEWPAAHAPELGFETVEAVFASGAPIALSTIAKGEPLLRSKLSGFGGDHSLSANLTSGKRAFTVRINDVSGVAGFVAPGDQVDVLLTRRIGGPEETDGDLVAKVILQNIVVIGIDQETAAGGTERPKVGRTATVEVTPQEAQTLALAMQVGTLSLVLRGIGSNETVEVENILASEAFGAELEPKPSAAAPSREAPPSMRIRRAGEVSTESTGR